jgi:DNA-directed RNA polymerase specialized sigma24 family protein
MEDCMNTKIEKALKNKDIVKIMNKASNSFRKQLDDDSIYTCQINALWKSFLNFKPEKNTKFTTYLYNGVFIECIKELKFRNKSKLATCQIHENISSKDTSTMIVDILDELSTEDERSLVLDKISNMTIDEMATKRNSNRETTRKKLNKALRKIRKKFSSCV